MTADITKVPLSRVEEIRLQRLEQIIVDGLQTFVMVGKSLAAIRAGRLYRQTHGTFVAYCQDRFGLSESHTYRTMDAAEIAAIVSPIGEVGNEAQARELVGLEPAQAREVYAEAVRETVNKPTARAIRDTRLRLVPQDQPPARGPVRWDIVGTARHAAEDAGKLAGRLSRIRQDGQLPQQIATVSAVLSDDLQRLITEAQTLLNTLQPLATLDDAMSSGACTGCGYRLDQLWVDQGETTHPGCA